MLENLKKIRLAVKEKCKRFHETGSQTIARLSGEAEAAAKKAKEKLYGTIDYLKEES